MNIQSVAGRQLSRVEEQDREHHHSIAVNE